MSRLSPDNVILGLLEKYPSHGYQLLEHFRDSNRLSSVWNLSTSQMYSILKRLDAKNYIEGYDEEPLDAPIRTVYSLTAKGREHFQCWLNEAHPSASTRAIRTEFLSRLYLCRLLGYPTQQIIDTQRISCETHRKDLLAQREMLSIGAGYLSLDLRVREMTLIIGWLEIAETMFSNIRKI